MDSDSTIDPEALLDETKSKQTLVPRSEYEAHLIKCQNDPWYNFICWFKGAVDLIVLRPGAKAAMFFFDRANERLLVYDSFRRLGISPKELEEFDKRLDAEFPPPVFKIVRGDNGWKKRCMGEYFEYTITILWTQPNE